jgi:hypothetical protein
MKRLREILPINELSKGKLQSYISSAVQDYDDAKSDLRTHHTTKQRRKATKRYVGIDRAVSKIAKRGSIVPANEVKTYARSPWRRSLGTSSAAAKAPGVKALGFPFATPDGDNKPTYTFDSEKAFADAKERLKARELFRRSRRNRYY